MDSVPWSLSLVAGAVAAVNPCGFALLPAYLTVLVLGETADAGSGTRASLLRGLRFGVGMTTGFVAVFGLAGLVLAGLTAPVEKYLPVVTIVIGVVLVLAGVGTVLGRTWGVTGLMGRGTGPTASWWSQVRYGVTFALASLSCTIGPFLAVTSGSLTTSGSIEVVASFVTYALGMGAVVVALAVAVVLGGGSVVAHVRRAVPVIARVSGVLLVAAGAYVAWYGWYELRVLDGQVVDDPLVSAAADVQSALTRAVDDAGAGAILAVLGVVTTIVVVVLAGARHRADAVRGVDDGT